MKVAFQIDEIKEITISNCTLYMAREAQNRGYEVFHFTPESLTVDNGKVYARANKMRVDLESEKFITLGEEKYLPLSYFDVVFIRQDPSLNMRFVINSYILEKAKKDTWIINDPLALRNAPEKLELFGFEKYAPPTLITLDQKQIEAFRKKHGDVIIKPLGGYRGRGVFHLSKGDMNLSVIMESLFGLTNLPVVVQKFIPEVVSEGNRRIFVLFGKVMGTEAFLQKPPKGKVLSFASGNQPGSIKLTKTELKIASDIATELHKRGIDIAGIDFIGKYLTEVNVITPGGFRMLRETYNIPADSLMWDHIESELKRRKSR